MRIDRSHRSWAVTAVVAIVAGFGFYLWYAAVQPGGPRGGTPIGLAFGIAGYALMIFEGLLGARKKVPVWRLGKATTWMRGHLWLGLVTLPFILYHGGFEFRGPLTLVLMILFFIVYASGIFGAILQHYLPTYLTANVPLETIYEEIPHVRAQLKDEAEELVNTLSVEAEHEDKTRFRQTYQSTIRPFLEAQDQRGLALADEERSVMVFESIRRAFPAALHPALGDLESICAEERQMIRQRRMYHLLHVWLLVHVPTSIALIVLGGVHALVALRY